MITAVCLLLVEVAVVILPTMLKVCGKCNEFICVVGMSKVSGFRLLQIEREKLQIYSIFVEVPVTVIRLLSTQAKHRFIRMQKEVENERHDAGDEVPDEVQSRVILPSQCYRLIR